MQNTTCKYNTNYISGEKHTHINEKTVWTGIKLYLKTTIKWLGLIQMSWMIKPKYYKVGKYH